MGRVAITATSAVCALGRTDAEVVGALRAGRSGLVRVSEVVPTWFGGVEGALDALPAPLAGLSTRQTALLMASLAPVQAAIAAAVARWGPDRVGVAVGTTTGGIGDTERHFAAWRATGAWPELDARRWLLQRHNLHATADALAALIGARGPALVQSSACASSAKVLATAQRWMEHGVVDAVVCAGVDSACRYTLLGFSGLGILSAERTRPFALGRNGINLGEAGAVLLLEREGVPQAWLRGVGETSDAWHMTQPRPDGAGLAAAIAEALRQGGVRAEEVGLVNAHATGTPANDLAEAAALRAVLPHGPWVTATKPLTGHTLGAAGALEAVLTVRSLQLGLVPPTCTGEPDPEVGAVRWTPAATDAPLRFAISTSAAFAGHNAAVLLEAA